GGCADGGSRRPRESRVQCAEQYRVQAYFDGEVDALSAIDIERHAERCPDCRTLLEDLARTRAHLRRELPFETAPAPLRARIQRALDAESGAPRAATRALRARRTRPFWLGALGSLGAARAAAVVYQHGAHVINVFAWVAGRDALPEATTRSGYHLAFWRVGNLEYCAVSDAGWDELRRLERLLRDLGAREQMP